MSDRLTAEPGTLEFLRQLLEIAKESNHPMDKALAKVLVKQIGEAEAEGTLKARMDELSVDMLFTPIDNH
jgi:hypothetical protein